MDRQKSGLSGRKNEVHGTSGINLSITRYSYGKARDIRVQYISVMECNNFLVLFFPLPLITEWRYTLSASLLSLVFSLWPRKSDFLRHHWFQSASRIQLACPTRPTPRTFSEAPNLATIGATPPLKFKNLSVKHHSSTASMTSASGHPPNQTL